MRNQSEPERTCIGCRSRMPKRSLLRFTADNDGNLVFDEFGNLPGRGAYVCPDPDCWSKVKVQKTFSRALRTEIRFIDWNAVAETVKTAI